MPRIAPGIGSLVLDDGRFCVPAIAAATGVAVGTAAATGVAVADPTVGVAATGVAVGEAAATGPGVNVAIAEGTGVGLAEGAIVNGGCVGGIITIGALH
jgi:hypothetical protein